MATRSTRTIPIWVMRLVLSPRSRSSSNSIAGLTLIECLVAIVIITITVVTITPPIFLATASRVQARRAEQANQVAQGEIDRIRTLIERQNYTLNTIPASVATAVRTHAAPSDVAGTLLSAGQCGVPKYPPPPSDTPIPAEQLIPVDVDGDCTPEYAMQVFRSSGCIPAEFQNLPTPPAPYSFDVGVRVYAYVPGQTRGYGIERASLKLTTGRNDLDLQANRQRPLQTIYTRVIRPNSSRSMECASADTAAPAPAPSPSP
ncbi:MAG: hypothetical protein NW220_10745 [Leptolyngbyaceae cyanobacterium bins.349]|nr:hypothetical protein [Leptolyngbyaceae cyanobacterium bins.349]